MCLHDVMLNDMITIGLFNEFYKNLWHVYGRVCYPAQYGRTRKEQETLFRLSRHFLTAGFRCIDIIYLSAKETHIFEMPNNHSRRINIKV